MSLAIEARNVSKHFGAVRALSDARLSVARGEIHALLGANGCGKSTLCKIVAGMHAPSSGSILVDGRKLVGGSPRDAASLGVGLFYQELSLIPALSVEANIFLGREPRTRGGFIDRARRRKETERLIALFAEVAGPGLDPAAQIGALSPNHRQIVEILKVLAKAPRVMIMDEASSALDARQVAVFFDILKARRAAGISTLLISHRLDEVFAIANRLTIMRNGETVAELAVAETDRETVVRLMVGDVSHTAKRPARSFPPHWLEVEKARGARLRDVSLAIAPGEIVGLGGLQAQGQSALLRGLFGAAPFAGGAVRLAGTPIQLRRPADAVRRGLAYVSGDRGVDAALPGRSIFENLAAALLVRERHIFVDTSRLQKRLQEIAARLKTKFAQLNDPIGTLSGGNQQKIFIARWLATAPKLLLLDDPTKGIDLGAKADLFSLVRGLAESGTAILLYSSEETELIDNADRVLVFNGGAIVAELAGPTLNALHLTRASYGDVA